MHTIETRNQFLQLRVQGLSFARIQSQIGVSKPTLIKWNRECRTEIQSHAVADHQALQQTLQVSHAEELARLKLKIQALRQELLSRSLRTFTTADLESLTAQMKDRFEKLEAVKKDCLCPPAHSPVVKPGQTWSNQKDTPPHEPR